MGRKDFLVKRYVEDLERNHAQIIQNRYRCSRCWNRVLVKHDKDGDYLDCGTDNCPCDGLITQGWVENQIMNFGKRATEAKKVLLPIFDWLKEPEKPKRNELEIMKDLGF